LLWQGDKEPKENGKYFAVLVTQAGNYHLENCWSHFGSWYPQVLIKGEEFFLVSDNQCLFGEGWAVVIQTIM